MANSKCENPGLCVMLGFLFSVWGMLIAAIIDGAEGVKNALWGILCFWLILIGSICAVVGFMQMLRST